MCIVLFLFRKDASPLVKSCSCYTCQNHTKAYINHLLNVHEMLAQILLEMYKILLFLITMIINITIVMTTLIILILILVLILFLTVADIILTIIWDSSAQ